MSNSNYQSKYRTFASGWIRKNKAGAEFISANVDSTRTKYKMLLQDEQGNMLEVKSFACFFQQEKKNEKAPDVSFTITVE